MPKEPQSRRQQIVDRLEYLRAAVRRGVASWYERAEISRLERELFDLDYQRRRVGC